jgi:hypothetical protein
MAFVPFLVRGTRTRLIYHLRLPQIRPTLTGREDGGDMIGKCGIYLLNTGLNFITKLPPSKKPIIEIVYDSILVITNKLTKYTYFISYKKSSSAKNLAYIFIKYIVINHKFPQRIINNRDKLFTSRF